MSEHLCSTCGIAHKLLHSAALTPFVQCPDAGVSLEPLLGPINLHNWFCMHEGNLVDGLRWSSSCTPHTDRLDWVIVGCESGPKRRPCNWLWQQQIVDQCRDAIVPVFVKQIEVAEVSGLTRVPKDPTECGGWPAGLRVRMFPGDRWKA